MKKKVGIIRALSEKRRKPVRSVRPRENTSLETAIERTDDDEQWQQDIAILRRAAQDLARRRSEQRVNPLVLADQFERSGDRNS